METSIQTFIEMCQWDTARFFIISENVFGSLVYYSHLLPFTLSLLMGVLIFFNDRKALLNKILFFITSAFCLWVFLDLILWATEKPHFTMFFWAVSILVEVLIYTACLYFVYIFIAKQDASFYSKIFFSILLLPVLLFIPTKLTLLGFDLTNCYREAIEGPIATYYTYIYEILISLFILVLAFVKYKKSDIQLKRQIILITAGVLFFLFSFSFGNIIGSINVDWTLGQYGLFGMPIFIAFLGYMIVSFKTFNVKLIATQGLMATIWILILGILFIRTIENVRVVTALTLILVTIAGDLLIKSVTREVKQKEELAKLNSDLSELIKQRESLVHLVTHKVKGSFTRSKYMFAGILDGTFGETSAEIKKVAEQGLESDNMGIETVDLVLNVANMQKGTVKYEMKPINLREIIEKSMSEKKVVAEARGLTIQNNIGEGAYNILGDAFWMKEAINNLLENSIKYTKTGGITVSLEKQNNKVLVSVKDTGVGITEEDKKGLFTEGGRGKDSVKVNVDSTGYGLYSVKLIIDAHKGRVWAESEGAGKGSTFFIELNAA